MYKKQYKTEGVVLRKFRLNEADLIVTLLTKDHGKIDCIAKSARRLKSRFLGRLELFNRVDMELFSGRTLENLNEAEVLSVQNGWGERLRNCGAAFFMTEVTHRFLQPAQQITGLYPLFVEALSLLQKHPNAEGVMMGYLIQLLGILGFMPSWRECARCGEVLDADEPIFLIERLAVGCASCADHTDETPVRTVKIVHYFQTHTLGEACRLDLSQDKDILWQWLQNVLSTLLPNKLKSAPFAESMLH